jgi:hypothetical protein
MNVHLLPPVDPSKAVSPGRKDMSHPPVQALPTFPKMVVTPPKVMTTGMAAPKTKPIYGMMYPTRYINNEAPKAYMG